MLYWLPPALLQSSATAIGPIWLAQVFPVSRAVPPRTEPRAECASSPRCTGPPSPFIPHFSVRAVCHPTPPVANPTDAQQSDDLGLNLATCWLPFLAERFPDGIWTITSSTHYAAAVGICFSRAQITTLTHSIASQLPISPFAQRSNLRISGALIPPGLAPRCLRSNAIQH